MARLETISEIESVVAAEEIIDGFKDKPEIRFGGSEAFYSPGEDALRSPYELAVGADLKPLVWLSPRADLATYGKFLVLNSIFCSGLFLRDKLESFYLLASSDSLTCVLMTLN